MVDRDFDNRTSLITRPSDGRLPAVTEAAKARAAAARARREQYRYDGPENLPLQVRCITYGIPRVGGLGAGYNSYYKIFQTADHVVMLGEMIHDARLIPIVDSPHIPPHMPLLRLQQAAVGHLRGLRRARHRAARRRHPAARGGGPHRPTERATRPARP